MIAMPVTEQSVVIARPPSEVWNYLTVAENWPSWESSIVECEQLTDGDPGVGTRWRGATRILGKRFEWVSEFVEYQPAKAGVSKSVEGQIGFTASTRLEEVDGGTLFTYRVDSDSGLGGIFGKLADPIVNKAYSRTVRASLDNLADLLTTES
ncbi:MULTISPECIES: SRPBCC family protein [Rhodococcus]|uniref:SRPBCC family protein n=1 Tax=Rhodococcus oxybenzonivorans TaxID=1990687 RepID=A0AAE5A8H3_9NOCA|nr:MULTISPECIES: SRPBCC family protein [Rhodococcus]MDV7240686.1 SRPBCC family protein [Rhodococcus oxybenzonivorans]MDV7267727.1 SRPBCC family protein [Rhodococcus oxybenzonivorans]MDV7272959.1 SRPBCC family protein [Rhodococcus oxybenzonivorans]MDV7333302.1 SRPBCC family protein [Rhodococcus oxybenzonivorans]MDV7342469.1 SRPBCC family protein [Rhodococcus oxybenzonivorans]